MDSDRARKLAGEGFNRVVLYSETTLAGPYVTRWMAFNPTTRQVKEIHLANERSKDHVRELNADESARAWDQLPPS